MCIKHLYGDVVMMSFQSPAAGKKNKDPPGKAGKGALPPDSPPEVPAVSVIPKLTSMDVTTRRQRVLMCREHKAAVEMEGVCCCFFVCVCVCVCVFVCVCGCVCMRGSDTCTLNINIVESLRYRKACQAPNTTDQEQSLTANGEHQGTNMLMDLELHHNDVFVFFWPPG